MNNIIFSFLLLFSTSAFSTQLVPVIWPFSVSASPPNILRTILNNANNSQVKYKFIFESKPGAGGSIAVNHVLSQSTPTLIATSTAVFTRPLFYPKESTHDYDTLQPVVVMLQGLSMAFVSKNITNIDQLNASKHVSIGIVAGSTIEIAAKVLSKSFPSTQFTLVPYPGTVESIRDSLGGHLDISVDFVRNSKNLVDSGKLNMIGLTGDKNIESYKTFSAQNIKGMERIVNNFYIAAPANSSVEFIKEMHDILTKARNMSNVNVLVDAEHGINKELTLKQTIEYWNADKQTWVNYFK